MTPIQAGYILERSGIPLEKDFHALSMGQVECLLTFADSSRYRAPKNANGSRARYYHAYLCRVARRQA